MKNYEDNGYDYDEDEQEYAIRKMKTRRNIYSIAVILLHVINFIFGGILGSAGLILVVLAMISAGLGMFCINSIRYTESRGRKRGGGLWWFILLLCGLFIVPMIVVPLCSHIKSLGSLVLGVEVE